MTELMYACYDSPDDVKILLDKASEFIISDKYATILTVTSYPKFISPGYLANLTSLSGTKVVIKHIPLPFSVIQKMINKEIADLKSRYQEEYDKTIQDINARTSIIHQEDQQLELRLKQLDTEQKALSTEMEAVQKIVQENIKETFKTFSS